MTKIGFVKGIEYIKAFYVNYKLDTQSALVLEIWSDVFKNMGDETFERLVKAYCLENIYPPQSPTHLLEFAKTKFAEKSPEAELEFEEVIKLNKRYSLRQNYNTIMLKIPNAITRTIVKALYDDFIEVGDETREALRKEFIRRYNNALNEQAQLQTNSLLGVKENKLIEWQKLLLMPSM